MDVINATAIDGFKKSHPNSRSALGRWERIASAATWSTPIDVRSSFPATDYVKGLYCFDIGGNNYRLIVSINFTSQEISVSAIMTPAKYNNWKA